MPSANQGFTVQVEEELITLVLAAFPLQTGVEPPRNLSAAQWQQMDAYATMHGLTGLFFDAVRQLGRTDVPPALDDDLHERVRRTTLAQGIAYRELALLQQAAAGAGMPLVTLKGAALARTLYPRPYQRSFGDLDLMIRGEDAERFVRVAQSTGFREGDSLSPDFRRTYYGEMGFYRAGSPGPPLDVHWGLVESVYFRKKMEMEWFWRNTETADLNGEPIRILNPTAQLVHLAIHAGLHHQDKPRLIWFYDLALLLTRRAAEIQWREADAYARHSGLARPVRYALTETQRRWGIDIPDGGSHWFVPPPHDLRDRVEYAVTTTAFTEARALSDVMATPGLRPKLAFARAQVFPDAAYMRARYNLRGNSWLPLFYVWRLFEGGYKFARSMWMSAMRRGIHTTDAM